MRQSISIGPSSLEEVPKSQIVYLQQSADVHDASFMIVPYCTLVEEGGSSLRKRESHEKAESNNSSHFMFPWYHKSQVTVMTNLTFFQRFLITRDCEGLRVIVLLRCRLFLFASLPSP